MGLRANFHTHSTFCDGTSTVAEMVERARELGFFALGFTGHMDPDIPMDWDAYSAEVRRLQAAMAGEIDILLGAELDNLHDPATVADAEYVIGSTHYVDANGGRVFVDYSADGVVGSVNELFGGDWYAYARAYYDFHAQVYTRTGCDIVGHFDMICRFNDQLRTIDEEDPRYLGCAREAMAALVGQGVPFEINTGGMAKGRRKVPYPIPALLRHLHELGGEIVINSDAHDVAYLDACLDEAVGFAREAGFTHTNMLRHDAFGNIEWYQVPLDTL